MGSRRSSRGFRTGVALVLIVLYNEIIHKGASASNNGIVSPYVSMWLPWLLLALFAGWRYAATCFTLRNDVVSSFIDRAGDAVSGLRHALLRRTGWSAAQ